MDSSAAAGSRDINYRSFSSSLLDQIYRSIDEQGPSKSSFHQPAEDHDHQRRRAANCLVQPAAAVGRRSSAAERISMRRRYERRTDEVFYGLNSSSSSCDSCGVGVGGSVKLKPPALIRTEGKENIKRPEKQRIGRHEHDDDEESKSKGKLAKKTKSKSKAAALKKIYSDLKQPISPGGRLASFLNSLFTTGSQKKRNNTTDDLVGISPQILLDRKSKSANASSTCSSRPSCLSSTTTTTTIPSEKCRVAGGKGMKRSVRFYPLDDCQLMPYGHTLYSSSLHQQQPMIKTHMTKEDQVIMKLNHNSNRQAALTNKSFNSSRKSSTEYHVNHSDEDDGSDSSSDLFELDHLSVDKYREELPVYKTTQLDTDELFV